MKIAVDYLGANSTRKGNSYGNGRNANNFYLKFNSIDQDGKLRIEFDFEFPVHGISEEHAGLVSGGYLTLSKAHALVLAAGILRFYTENEEKRDRSICCFLNEKIQTVKWQDVV